MNLKITRTNNSRLAARRKELEQDLRNIGYAMTGGVPLTMNDVRDLATLGLLSRGERALYDEFRRIELLLRRGRSPESHLSGRRVLPDGLGGYSFRAPDPPRRRHQNW